jgi:hypothetical protein
LDRPQIQKIEKESAMTSNKKVAYLILLSSFTVIFAGQTQAQVRKTTTTQTYTPPPAPREVSRPEPQPDQRQVYRPQPQPEQRQTYVQPGQDYKPQNARPGNDQYNSYQSGSSPDIRPNLGARHANATVVRYQAVSPTIRHAMTYNTRPNGARINPQYFATHFGYAYGFHLAGWSPGCPTCGFAAVFNGEWYFGRNGATFGLMGPMPGNWALATDYLYVDIGDDGNYYLYDAQYPNLAVQLTFVQNMGDDQAGADQDQGEGSGQ